MVTHNAPQAPNSSSHTYIHGETALPEGFSSVSAQPALLGFPWMAWQPSCSCNSHRTPLLPVTAHLSAWGGSSDTLIKPRQALCTTVFETGPPQCSCRVLSAKF